VCPPSGFTSNSSPTHFNLALIFAGQCQFNEFNHLDFIWGLRAGEEIYTNIVNIIKGEPMQCNGNAKRL
jgi:hypothetical protein